MNSPDSAEWRIDVQRLLAATSLRHVECHGEIASTNDQALRIGGEDWLELPALVVAERQTSGRGRGENKWWTGRGALTFSLILPPESHGFSPRNLPCVSLVSGLAVVETLRERLPIQTPRLKWPNDVFLGSRKLCGILVESTPGVPKRLVIGIGLNVNNRCAAAPPPLRDLAVSLLDVTGRLLDRTGLLIDLVEQLQVQLSRTGDAEFSLSSLWRPHCLLEGRLVRVETGGQPVMGVCQGIDDEGALLLRNEAGGVDRCYAGVVTMIS